MRRGLRLLLCMLMLGLSLIPIQAFGHTKLVEMDPKPQSQLEQSPERVMLVFSEKLENVSEKSLYVEDEEGNSIEAGTAVIGNEGMSMVLTLPELSKGSYTVRYQIMSRDGHIVQGDYSFTVLTDIERTDAHDQDKPEVSPAVPEEQVENEAPAAPDKQVENEAPTQVTSDYGVAPTEDDQSLLERLTSVLTGITAVDALRMVYFAVFLVLIGMMMWYVMLRHGRSKEDTHRHRNWIVQVQRIHIIVLIVIVFEFVQRSVGFSDWQLVKDVLLHTTAGTSWFVLLLLSSVGLGVLQRNKWLDLVWIIAVVATMTQIGHAASAEYRIFASILTAIHLFAAAIWAGGLLYVSILWGRYRHIAEKFILKFSNASLIAIALLVISGILRSILYLSDISNVFETQWGLILIVKIVVVVFVVILGASIRRFFIRKGNFQIGTWIKLDFVMLLVISSLAALLTAVEPNPPNEPLHWHVMGDSIHMTAKITPNIPGDNQFTVSVWLPENAGAPQIVSMQIVKESDENPQDIVLTMLEHTANNYGFGGFNEFTFQAESDQLDQPGTWLINIDISNQQGQTWTYKKQIRVY